MFFECVVSVGCLGLHSLVVILQAGAQTAHCQNSSNPTDINTVQICTLVFGSNLCVCWGKNTLQLRKRKYEVGNN